MTNSDQLMLAAIKAQVSFKINGREVAVDGEKTTVMLHGEKVAIIDSKVRKITLYARTRVSRKSTRVFNCILKEFTGCSVLSKDGQWILKLLSGRMEPLGTREVIIPIKKIIMTKFVEMKRQDGKAVLVNLERVDTATFNEENQTVTVLMPEGEMTFVMNPKDFREEAEEKTLDRISGNLFPYMGNPTGKTSLIV